MPLHDLDWAVGVLELTPASGLGTRDLEIQLGGCAIPGVGRCGEGLLTGESFGYLFFITGGRLSVSALYSASSVRVRENIIRKETRRMKRPTWEVRKG